MNYRQTIDYLFSALPMYHRIGAAAYKADISATITLMQALGNPEQQLKHVIHVAGTNGKGSVSHMLASVLQQAGFKVGLYTSPHLIDFRERIRINGKMVPHSVVTDFVNHNKWLLDSGKFSFFEMTVGIAFQWFVDQNVDVAVVEVGMGGRLDSTNVLPHPDLSVITNIGLDHTQFLGNSLSEIAMEKAGIIKDNVPVVIGETQAETTPVFLHVAEQHHAHITFADQHFQLIDRTTDDPEDEGYLCFDVLHDGQLHASDMLSPLSGSYQLHNIATVFQCLDRLLLLPYYRCITPHHIARGIERVIMDTGLHGRWEIIRHDPLTICETAHNAPGINAMLDKLSTLHYRKLHIVYGCVNDKDYLSILKMLPTDATYYLTQPSVPRALPVNDLAEGFQSLFSSPNTSNSTTPNSTSPATFPTSPATPQVAPSSQGIPSTSTPNSTSTPTITPASTLTTPQDNPSTSNPAPNPAPNSNPTPNTSSNLTSPSTPPATPSINLPKFSTHPNVKKAISAARAAASKDDLVLVTGSIFLVADALS